MSDCVEEIVLYSTHCPKCKVLEAKLQQKNIKYTEVTDMDVMQSKGFMSVPILEVNNKAMNFKDANNWINGLEG